MLPALNPILIIVPWLFPLLLLAWALLRGLAGVLGILERRRGKSEPPSGEDS
jgi:hypothetical protein